MKKSISLLVLLAIAATGVFAQESSPMKFSFGGGVYFDVGAPMWENSEGAVIGFGGFGFFDLTYAEVDVGVGYYRLTDAEIYGADLKLGLLLKYPIDLGSFTIFPAAGVKFTIPLSQSYDGNSIPWFETKDHVHFGLQAGVGFDIPLGRSLFLRPTALFDVNFLAPGEDPFDDTLYTIGPTVKVGLGYKF